MRTTKITKKIWAMMLVLAMVVTSISYTPETVKADTTANLTIDGKKYTITIDSTDGITGAFLQGAFEGPLRFGFAWDPVEGGNNILIPTIENGDNDIVLPEVVNGGAITAESLANCNLETKTYDITLVGSGALEGKNPVGKLKVELASEEEETTTGVTSSEYGTITTNGSHDGVFQDISGNYKNLLRNEGVTATASSGDAMLAIDNNAGTRWESEQKKDPQHLLIDLGELRAVNEVKIRWEAAQAKNYTIEFSDNGTDYTTMASVFNAQEGGNRLDTLTLTDDVNARYIKINGTARNLDYGYSIWEIAVYGLDDPVAITPTQVEPDGAIWTEMGSTDNAYFEYYASENASKLVNKTVSDGNVWISVTEFAAPFHSVKVCGIEVEKTNDGNLYIPTDTFSADGIYDILIKDSTGTNQIKLYVKKTKIDDYKAKNITGSVNGSTVTISWTESEDAVAASDCTYNVLVTGVGTNNGVDGTSTSFTTAEPLEYGNYDIAVKTVRGDAEVATATG
ncbi:MAG: discoidin domain-containing protein, partial [Lachnospiraceae bacterium]|nr:discoidin domain-containing protein [Lachnospiraceae bacterium]